MALSPLHLDLMAKQHWVATVEQLAALDLSVRTIERHRRSGVLEQILPGIVRLAAAPESGVGRGMAALLYVGGLSALTAETAGAEYGLRRMHSRLIHLMIEESRNPRAAPWIRIHRTSWLEPEDIAARPNGLRVLEPNRLLFEFAAGFPKEKFRAAAEDMWHRQLIDPGSAALFLRRNRRQGRSGVRRFEEWLEETGGRSRAMMSALETDLVDALERVGLPTPARQHAVRLASGQQVHIDIAFPDVALGVEPGAAWWHGGDVRMRRDYERDNDCTAVGWQIMRFDDEQLKIPLRCAEKVRQTYLRRHALLGRSPA